MIPWTGVVVKACANVAQGCGRVHGFASVPVLATQASQPVANAADEDTTRHTTTTTAVNRRFMDASRVADVTKNGGGGGNGAGSPPPSPFWHPPQPWRPIGRRPVISTRGPR